MVMLHVKRSEKDTFLYETPAATEVDAVLRNVIAIHNLRCKVARLSEAAEGLAAHGPMKPPEQQGLDDETPLLEDYDVTTGLVADRSKPVRNENYRPDPTDKRTGNAPPDEIAAVIARTVDDAKALIAERQVAMKVVASARALEEAINNVKGATMIAYPMGLPDYDPVRQILEERESLEGAAQLQVGDVGLNKRESKSGTVCCCCRQRPRRAPAGSTNIGKRAHSTTLNIHIYTYMYICIYAHIHRVRLRIAMYG